MDTSAEHAVGGSDRHHVATVHKVGLVCMGHIDVKVAGGGITDFIE